MTGVHTLLQHAWSGEREKHLQSGQHNICPMRFLSLSEQPKTQLPWMLVTHGGSAFHTRLWRKWVTGLLLGGKPLAHLGFFGVLWQRCWWVTEGVRQGTVTPWDLENGYFLQKSLRVAKCYRASLQSLPPMWIQYFMLSWSLQQFSSSNSSFHLSNSKAFSRQTFKVSTDQSKIEGLGRVQTKHN
jgi:hypothetical protein